MAIIKCKMCGGELNIVDGASTAECEFCGSVQTLPKANDDVIRNLFNRANNLRLKCEFDKAEQIYEKILHENDAEAEAHWGIVLCKYGIEYVEDPKTFKRVPTCHRTLFEAVTADADYLAAVDYSDAAQQAIYEREARAIDRIQKDILSIVKNEKPFDVFICYKETDENGKRTVDSTIANDIYYQLTQEGLKVFYAAITLEDKLGQEYEPYIFAALNSAKVMLVIGTRPEYFTAVWVKNEWSRFLKLMKADRSKLLIPCYRDMDAYDLPEEFAHLQAQDMSKIGFISDVVRGIRKVTVKEEAKAPAVSETVSASGNANIAPLLKRAFMFLEDGDWHSANVYCEKVLDIDPENATAYLGKLMVDLGVKRQENLKDQPEPFNENGNYQKAIRFADDSLKDALIRYHQHIITRNENARLEGIYVRATKAMQDANTENAYREAAGLFETIMQYKDAEELVTKCEEMALECIYTRATTAMQDANTENACKEAAKLFQSISQYKDSAALEQKCYEKAEAAQKDSILAEGKAKMAGEFIASYKSAIVLFQSISGWKDADQQICVCEKKIIEIQNYCREAERIARRNKKLVIIASSIICAIIAFVIVLTTVIISNNKYNDAIALMNAEKYTEAITAFEALDGYKDSANKITACNTAILDGKYNDAIALMDEGKYTEAITAFEALDGYKDSANKITECNAAIPDGKYNDAIALMNAGNIVEAYEALVALDGYRDSADKANSIYDKYKVEKLKVAKVGDYVFFGAYEQDNNTSNGKEDVEWLVLEIKDGKALVISRYALDCQKYNTSGTGVTWETCTLRKWLNNNFLGSAFTADEKAMIPTVTVSADKNPRYGTNPGNAIQDQVFLLSITEANKYFSSDSARQCKPTDYAVANGAYDTTSNGNWRWWLRSPGYSQIYAVSVYSDGNIGEGGISVYNAYGAVRPALWIDLNS